MTTAVKNVFFGATLAMIAGVFAFATPVQAGCDGSIGNTVYLDHNKNGVQDPGEGGIDDVSVKLIDGNDVTKDKTNSRGRYKFKGLCDGDYTVVVHADHIPSGCYQTADPDKKRDHTTDVELDGDNDGHTKADFGYKCPSVGHTKVAPKTGPATSGLAVVFAMAAVLTSVIFAIAHKRRGLIK